MSYDWIDRRRAAVALRCISVVLLAATAIAQDSPTQRLLALLRLPDPGRNHQEFLSAVVEAGPAAIPALDRLLGAELSAQRRKYVLASICLIGGSQAVSIVQREHDGRDKTLKPALAAVLATADSPQNRASLIRMLGETSDDGATFQAAALALGLLRAREGLAALQSFSPTAHSAEAEIVELALQWITNSEWVIDTRNGGERDRVVAAVLRIGIPGVSTGFPVFDETTRKVWNYGASGWTFSRAPAPSADRVALGPIASSVLSTDGTRATVSVEFRCGPGCEGGAYDFVLRKASGQWRVQSIFPAWRA